MNCWNILLGKAKDNQQQSFDKYTRYKYASMANYNSAINRRCVPGKIYGYLTIVKFITNKNMWQCTCICGKTVYRQGAALLKYKNPNCGCKKGTYALLPNQLAHKNAIISDYKRHAKDRNIEFKLTVEQAVIFFEGNCYYCGSKPSNLKTVKPSRKLRAKYNCTITNYFYNGIDRINSDLGYEEKNCVSCCLTCNRSKSDLTVDDWKIWINNLYQKMFNDQSKDVGSSDPKRESPL